MSKTQKAKKETKVVDKPAIIFTKAGYTIAGDEIVGNKAAALFCEAVNAVSAGALSNAVDLANVVFRNDGFPKDAYAITFADTSSIAINVKKCWDRALEVAEKGEKHVSVIAAYWINLLSTYGHELDHLALALADREVYEHFRSTDDGHKELEAAAKQAEVQVMIHLARDVDVEIPKAEGLGVIGMKMMDLFTNEETKDLDWVVRSRKMMEEGCVYRDEANGIEYFSFRDFIQGAYEIKDTTGWEQPVAHVDLNCHLEDGSVILQKAELVPEPKIEVSEEEPKEVVMTAADNGVFVQAADAEAEAEVIETAPEEEVEELTPDNFVGDDSTEAPTNTAAFVPPPVPDTPAVAAQKEQFAAAAQTASAPAPETTPPFPKLDIPMENIQACMKTVYQLLYHHIFTKCGWEQNQQTGKHYFKTAANVLQAVDVRQVIKHYGCEGLIQNYQTVDANGVKGPEDFGGVIRGFVSSKQGLPMYVLTINMGGHGYERAFVPQNPEKLNAQNAYGPNALEAQQGNHIAYVYKGEVPKHADFKVKCSVLIKNNDYQVMS